MVPLFPLRRSRIFLLVSWVSVIAMEMMLIRNVFIAACCLAVVACEKKESETQASAAPSRDAPMAVNAPVVTPASSEPAMKVRPIRWTDELLHTEIKHYNPAYEGGAQLSIENGVPTAVVLAGQKVDNLRAFEGIPLQALDLSDTLVADLSPLRGLPLRQLMIERTKVSDLSPLKGMKLEMFYASGTPVQDTSALLGMPLTEVNLVGTKVKNLAGLSQSPISMLWLTDCPVEDISPLRTVPMVSLTLHRTQVKDLSPLSGTSLQRLHIGETPVEDLSPLRGMALTRLVFTPTRIKKGLDAAKELPLQEIGTRFDDETKDLAPPAVFWASQPASEAAVK